MTEPARIRLDESNPTPAFEQIRRQIVGHIASGALPVGAKLPPLRQLARDLGIAVNTAAHAYRLLDEAGLIRTRRGAGTTVIAIPASETAAPPRPGLAPAAARFFDDAAATGATTQEAVEAILAESRRRSRS